jgi:hypothetical protein
MLLVRVAGGNCPNASRRASEDPNEAQQPGHRGRNISCQDEQDRAACQQHEEPIANDGGKTKPWGRQGVFQPGDGHDQGDPSQEAEHREEHTAQQWGLQQVLTSTAPWDAILFPLTTGPSRLPGGGGCRRG